MLGKFAKMAAMGVPAAAVALKMAAEGLPAPAIRRFELAFALISPIDAATADRNAARARAGVKPGGSADCANANAEEDEEEEEAEPAPVDKETLKADPLLGKFAKMASMGVPPASVVHRMGVSAQVNRARVPDR